jgi:hypothetical protein
MEKRRITAREILADVRTGAGDPALMEKYKLSAQGLQSVFNKLLRAGVLTQQELDDRVPMSQRTVDLGLNICRACGHIEAKEFTKCPRCGFVPPDAGKTAVSREVDKRGSVVKKEFKKSTTKRKPIGPVTKGRGAQTVEQTGEDEEVAVPRVQSIKSYCLTMAIVSVAAYVLVVVGLFVVMAVSIREGFPSMTQVLVGGLAAALAASVMLFLALFTLRSLSELTKVLTHVDQVLSHDRSLDLDRPIA